MADFGDRSGVAPPDAGRADHPDARADRMGKCRMQRLSAGQFAADAVADPYGQRWDGLVTFADNVEVGVERGDFIRLSEGHAKNVAEGAEVGGRDLVVGVLNEMEVFDQQVASARAVAK